jgi:hypothetical protein
MGSNSLSVLGIGAQLSNALLQQFRFTTLPTPLEEESLADT